MTGWSVKGEAGKNITATERLVSELNCDGATLTTASLDMDMFEYTAAASNATGSGVIIPTMEQLLEVFYNGTRRFRGHCTIPRITNNQLSVTVTGPWEWMQKMNLNTTQTDAVGTTGTRPVFVFPTQSVTLSLQQLIDRMIADGVPIRRGTIDTCFTFPRITLSEISYAQALADLLSTVADAVAWFDYADVTGNGYPILNVTRRGNMTAQTHTIGTDPIEKHDLYPRLETKVESVTVNSAARNATTGKTEWVSQTYGPAGAGSSGAAGKRQMVVVSGPEVDTFLPRDQFDTFQCQALPLTSTTAISNYIIANDPTLATLKRDYNLAFTMCATVENIVSAYVTGLADGGWSLNTTAPALLSKSPTTNLYVVVSPDRVPEWMVTENKYTVTDATLQGWAKYVAGPTFTPPAHWTDIEKRAAGSTWGYPYYPAANGNATPNKYTYYAFFQFSIPVQLISRKVTNEFATLTDVYRLQDHDYVQAPADLAQNLLACQNWLPWEGYITRVFDEVDGAPMLHLKHHVANALPDCATMGALARSVSYDIMRKRRTITFGAPARVDFGSLAAKFRRNAKSNIVMMTGGVAVDPVGNVLSAI